MQEQFIKNIELKRAEHHGRSPWHLSILRSRTTTKDKHLRRNPPKRLRRRVNRAKPLNL